MCTYVTHYNTVYVHFAACALQFLRSKGVAHMDLKPQNLLLSVTGNRKYVLKVGGTHVCTSIYIIYVGYTSLNTNMRVKV